MTVFDAIASPGCGCEPAAARPGGPLSIDAALDAVAAALAPRAGTELVPFDRAAGRVLAAPLRARGATPPFDAAAMDGWALRRADLAGEGPWTLRAAQRLAAGDAPAGPLAPGAAARIFTGAPVPPGADAVVAQERIAAAGGLVLVHARPAEGENIRRAGEELRSGAPVLPAGRRLAAREIAAAAAAGHDRVAVRPRPRAALLVTGAELRPAGAALSGGAIRDVNGPMLAAALAAAGAPPVASERVGDDPAALAAALVRLAATADLVVTTGGVSVGDADHLPGAIAAAGGAALFRGVAMKPGAPLSFGRIGGAAWLGLPGNPLAAYVGWTLFGRLALDRLAGVEGARPRSRLAVIEAPLSRKPGRCELRPARLAGQDGAGREVIALAAATRSARATDLAAADGLAFVPADCDALPAGALIEFLPFDAD